MNMTNNQLTQAVQKMELPYKDIIILNKVSESTKHRLLKTIPVSAYSEQGEYEYEFYQEVSLMTKEGVLLENVVPQNVRTFCKYGKEHTEGFSIQDVIDFLKIEVSHIIVYVQVFEERKDKVIKNQRVVTVYGL